MKTIIKLITVLAITLSISSAYAWGDKKEKIKFQSISVFSWKELLDNKPDPSVQVYGTLVIPKKTEGKIPAIVFVHGSGGPSQKHKKWLKQFNKMGIATFQLNCFKPRKVSSTVGDQFTVSSGSMTADAFNALKILSNHPRIDANRIGIMGGSKGGTVAMAAAWKPVIEKLGGLKFACHISLYPSCGEYETYSFSESPILIMIGEKDEWTPAPPCVDFGIAMKEHGYNNIKVVVYPDAHHSFDADHPVSVVRNGHSYKECRWLIEDDGNCIETTTGANAYTEWNKYSKVCVKKGVKNGGQRKAKKLSMTETITFVSRVFKLNENVASNSSKNKLQEAKTALVSSGYNSTGR